MPYGSASLERDIAPPRRNRATIRRRKDRPRASSINCAFFLASPDVKLRPRSFSAFNFRTERSVACSVLFLIRRVRAAFQYLVIKLSIGGMGGGNKSGIFWEDVVIRQEFFAAFFDDYRLCVDVFFVELEQKFEALGLRF